jgi:hypothetical protein
MTNEAVDETTMLFIKNFNVKAVQLVKEDILASLFSLAYINTILL